eukprot:g1612.t1
MTDHNGKPDSFVLWCCILSTIGAPLFIGGIIWLCLSCNQGCKCSTSELCCEKDDEICPTEKPCLCPIEDHIWTTKCEETTEVCNEYLGLAVMITVIGATLVFPTSMILLLRFVFWVLDSPQILCCKSRDSRKQSTVASEVELDHAEKETQ